MCWSKEIVGWLQSCLLPHDLTILLCLHRRQIASHVVQQRSDVARKLFFLLICKQPMQTAIANRSPSKQPSMVHRLFHACSAQQIIGAAYVRSAKSFRPKVSPGHASSMSATRCKVCLPATRNTGSGSSP